jgi:cobalt-zinc-cadmium efflux system protein
VKAIVREVHKINGVNKLHHIHTAFKWWDELHLEAHLDCLRRYKKKWANLICYYMLVEQVLFNKFHINHINIQLNSKKKRRS